jgi:very-short-patch-repair endonuclease
MRFNSSEVLTDTEVVVEAIYRRLKASLPD